MSPSRDQKIDEQWWNDFAEQMHLLRRYVRARHNKWPVELTLPPVFFEVIDSTMTGIEEARDAVMRQDATELYVIAASMVQSWVSIASATQYIAAQRMYYQQQEEGNSGQ